MTPLPPPAVVLVAVAQGEAPVGEVWRVDQLRLPADTSEAKLKALEPDQSLDAVIRHLQALGVPFTRTEAALIPGRMPDKLRTELSKLPKGEPFILPGEDFITVNVIVGRQVPSDAVRYRQGPAAPAPTRA